MEYFTVLGCPYQVRSFIHQNVAIVQSAKTEIAARIGDLFPKIRTLLLKPDAIIHKRSLQRSSFQ